MIIRSVLRALGLDPALDDACELVDERRGCRITLLIEEIGDQPEIGNETLRIELDRGRGAQGGQSFRDQSDDVLVGHGHRRWPYRCKEFSLHAIRKAEAP